jgi:hypothetical protein
LTDESNDEKQRHQETLYCGERKQTTVASHYHLRDPNTRSTFISDKHSLTQKPPLMRKDSRCHELVLTFDQRSSWTYGISNITDKDICVFSFATLYFGNIAQCQRKERQWCSGNMEPFQGSAGGSIPP